jgi:hypothetical protein
MKTPLTGLGDIGWLPDQARFELAPNAVTDLRNFRMRNGWAEKVGGYQQVFADTADVPYSLAPFATATSRFLIHATASGVWADGGDRTNISGSGMTAVDANRWTSAVMNGVFALCNGADSPMYWTGDTSTTLAVMPGWDTADRARSIAALRYHWVTMGITRGGVSYPHRVKISAAALPGSPGTDWDQTDPTNDAYEADVVGDGILVWALPLGDGLVLYKEKSMALLRYTGDPQQVWSIQPLTIPYGMLAVNCGVVVPGVGHVVLTRDDVIAHDGFNADSILDGKARDELRNNIDPIYFAESFVTADYARSEVHISYPEKGNQVCTKTIIWNWKTKTIGRRDEPNVTCGCSASFDYAAESFDNDSATFDSESTLTFDDTSEIFGAHEARIVMGTTGSKLVVMDSTDLADGQAFTGYVEFGGLSSLMPQLKGRRQLLSECWLDIDAAAGTVISVYFGAAEDPSSDFTYEAPFTFTVGTDRKAEAFASGPYIAIKLESTAAFRVRSMFPVITDEGEF